jgi:arsenite methyltransferase
MDENAEKGQQPSSWPPTGGIRGCHQSSDENATVAAGSSGHVEVSPGNLDAIRTAIRQKYAEVAISAEGKFSYPTGRAGAEALGYDPGTIQQAPSGLMQSFCGVGNPFSLGEILPGETVLDYGSGAGFDLFVASRVVGEEGLVCGVDLTRDMVERAIGNLSSGNFSSGGSKVEVRQIDGDQIPYPDHFFDVVISNGVINLTPSKMACFRELYRVLKPGGRIQFADVVLEQELPAGMAGSPEAWSQWIGGAIPVRDQIRLMEEAGFKEVASPGTTGFRTSQYTVGALFRGVK